MIDNNNEINNTKEKKHKKLNSSILIFGLCTVLLIASTYAWFIGMKTVNVSAFDVQIAAIDGLSLSLTGEPNSWSDKIIINEANHKSASYEGNTNSWGEKGLIPMSSVGKINPDSSRLTLFEKASFTATPGGYRIMSTEVANGVTDGKEADGYVAFDLFIKNLSGHAYYDEVNVLNEEAIYLTPESTVKVAVSGGNEENSGIENSVRVAFAQIGRVRSDASASIITGIDCSGTGEVLSICENRDATIWEPNDKKHVQNSINWYDKSCKARTGADLTKDSSYGGKCGDVVNGEQVPTYAISGEIKASDRVDTYDGEGLNGYTGSTATTPTDGKLMKMKYFTDTMKNLEGTERPEFITLAPNSVTKVRIYVYLEGQDVDNYDFASLGKKISVSFGFTKERFYGEDIHYNEGDEKGPSLGSNLQERPINAPLVAHMESLCVDTETCISNGMVKDEYNNMRFIGQNPDNYIQFNGEVWRIIGLFETKTSTTSERTEKRIKIVKNEVLDELRPFDSENSQVWLGSDLQQYLNGEYYDSLSEKNKISKVVWNTGPYSSGEMGVSPSLIYASEIAVQDSESIVGIVNISDYAYASGVCTSILDSSCIENNWMSLLGLNYTVMNPYKENEQGIWYINNDGKIYGYFANYSRAVRPVVYLNSDVVITGNGSLENMFKIS